MFLIVGLGNPGKKYQLTRHNIGFRVIDQLKKRDVHYFSDFRFVKESNSLISEGIFNDKKIILAKPQTFMNLSGKSVKSLIQKLTNSAMTELLSFLYIVHDDIDLPVGKIRISKGRGAAGHKGVESIIKELKTKDFIRFRIGIRPKSTISTIVENVNRFVLQKFNKEEEKILKEVIKKAVEAIKFSLKYGLDKAMNVFNK